MPEWGFQTTYREIREMVLAELDYRMEAEAMRRIAANFAERPEVRLPRVIGEHSTGRVLTTEWMPGTKAADLAGLAAAGVDRRRAARLVVDAYCQQIFIDGIYHADPHPGNLLLRAERRRRCRWCSWTSAPRPRSRPACARGWCRSSRGR